MPLINAVWYVNGNMDILVTEVDLSLYKQQR